MARVLSAVLLVTLEVFTSALAGEKMYIFQCRFAPLKLFFFSIVYVPHESSGEHDCQPKKEF
jgi:hypothetical protein